jgi:hypothetical protein
MISYVLIKTNNTGLYGKPIEWWNKRDISDHQRWAIFRSVMVAEYK